ncbi:MAG: hypothetical protein GDA48_12295 [Hormoscilla sp. GM102CHS1]|nr:hypothetical protein [Hormoscilla sp. GM102CHS1]
MDLQNRTDGGFFQRRNGDRLGYKAMSIYIHRLRCTHRLRVYSPIVRIRKRRS